VVPDDRLLTFARQLAGEIAANDPLHVTRMKAVMDAGFATNLGEGLRLEAARAKALNGEVSSEAIENQRHTASEQARRSL
jgi:enoyl-CoA hydratase/carnithine racemase